MLTASSPALCEILRRKTESRLIREQAAQYLGLKPQTLASDVCTRRLGIPFYKVGRLVYYDIRDLDAWLAARRVALEAV